ncbi:hypothetical protein [Aureispira anguillae]|uniref:Restriction endonuclease type II-like domain-containing protein n=1 Tax=Aureispira anguillae TaxID=2864201 RepID=A0A915YCB8_9BACT|nr:hypothetical protein [Aureispira anguillae]BDS10470.1 hypothetical protein AsAng_0011780 [Aureispira anguillae]
MDTNKESTAPSTNYTHALPYLSVLPITEQCLDFSIINRVEPELTERILQTLLSNASDVIAHIPLGISKKMPASQLGQYKALQKTFENFQVQKDSLSIGYPIVLIDDVELGRPVAAPLFLWKIELNIAPNSNMEWTLTPLNKNKGYLNPILKNYLEARFKLDWEQQIGLIDTVDSKVVNETCLALAKELELDYQPTPLIEACPSPDNMLQNVILNAIILGSFEPITLKEAQKLPKNLKPRERKQWKTKVAALPCNSAQDELIETIFDGHHVIAEGISNTGKTHTIASILPSLLTDKGSALIISPQAASFNEIQYHLENLGIKDIGILNLQDEVLDKERLIKYLEKLPKRTRSLSSFDNVTYTKQLDKHSRLREQLEKAYESLHASVVNGWNWTELVGQCLMHHKKSDKQILGRFLDNKDFLFTAKEEYVISRELGEHYIHYHRIDALKHPLNALHGRFFNDDSSIETTREEAKTGLNVYRYKINSLYQSFLVFVGNYAEHLKFEYRDFVANMEQQINKIERNLHLYNDLYGEAFDKQSSLQNAKLKLLSMFSRRHQEIRAAKGQLLDDYQELQAYYEQAAYFKTDFPNIKEESKLADVEVKLEKVRSQLQDWAITIPSLVDQQIEDLSIETQLPQAFQEQHKELEISLVKLVEQINSAQILRKEIQLPEGKVTEKEVALFNILLQFHKLENEWRDIDAYYQWRRSWLTISGKTQKVVQALVNAGSQDWISGFHSWYYHQILTQQYSIVLPKGTANEALPFDAYIHTLKDIQQRISQKANVITKERQGEQIKRIKKEKDLTLTNARPIFRNKKIKDLLQWIGLEHLGDVFPIVLATPEMAQQLLGLKISTFDLVIVDNAHDLSAKIGTDLLKLGNQRIVLGRPIEEEKNEKESLLEWMLAQKGRRYQFLEHIHSKDVAQLARLNQTNIQAPNAFQIVLVEYLKEYIDEQRLQFNKSVEGVLVDLIIAPKYSGQTPIAVICDGGLLHQAKYDFQLAIDKVRILTQASHQIHYIWSIDWWKNSEKALEPLLAFVLKWDKQHNNATA